MVAPANPGIVYSRDPATGNLLMDANGFPVIVGNAAGNTYGGMQTRIQSEVLGSPTTTQIQNMIQDSILEYERQDFYFNQIISSNVSVGLTTVIAKEWYGQEALPLMPLLPHIEKIMVVFQNNRYPLEARTPQWIDDQSLSFAWQGMPTDWAYSSQALRLYPIPNLAYPLIITGNFRFYPLVNSSDFNPWVQEAEELIRCAAKMRLFRHITRDEPMAVIMEHEVKRAYEALKLETSNRAGGPGRIRPSRGHF